MRMLFARAFFDFNAKVMIIINVDNTRICIYVHSLLVFFNERKQETLSFGHDRIE
jgi:hypothetical protein